MIWLPLACLLSPWLIIAVGMLLAKTPPPDYTETPEQVAARLERIRWWATTTHPGVTKKA